MNHLEEARFTMEKDREKRAMAEEGGWGGGGGKE